MTIVMGPRIRWYQLHYITLSGGIRTPNPPIPSRGDATVKSAIQSNSRFGKLMIYILFPEKKTEKNNKLKVSR